MQISKEELDMLVETDITGKITKLGALGAFVIGKLIFGAALPTLIAYLVYKVAARQYFLYLVEKHFGVEELEKSKKALYYLTKQPKDLKQSYIIKSQQDKLRDIYSTKIKQQIKSTFGKGNTDMEWEKSKITMEEAKALKEEFLAANVSKEDTKLFLETNYELVEMKISFFKLAIGGFIAYLMVKKAVKEQFIYRVKVNFGDVASEELRSAIEDYANYKDKESLNIISKYRLKLKNAGDDFSDGQED